jgi:hypothetical protein
VEPKPRNPRPVACIDAKVRHVLKPLDLIDPSAVDVQPENLCRADQVSARLRLLPRVNAANKNGRRLGPRYVEVFGTVLEDDAQAKTSSRKTISVPPNLQRAAHAPRHVWARRKQATL